MRKKELTQQRNIPPKTANHFLNWFLRDDLAEDVQGDLEEQFQDNLERGSPFRAKIKYWFQVFNYLRPFAIRNFKMNYQNSNYQDMLLNNIKTGWRSMVKKKTYSIINISGLTAGITVALLTGLWIHDELYFNRYFKNYDSIARLMQNQTFNGEIVTWPSEALQSGPALRNKFSSDFKHVVMGSGAGNHKLLYENKSIVKKGNFMGPGIAEMLTLKMISGSRKGLEDPHSILLSESTSHSLFGDTDPMNKVIQIDNSMEVNVTGIYEDIPDNTTFENLEFISSWQLFVTHNNLEQRLGWGNSWFECFVQLHEHADFNDVSDKIKNIKRDAVAAKGIDVPQKPELFLFPMSRWHLYSEFKNGVSTGGDIRYVRMFGIAGFIVLLLACINFMNLSTARSEKRAREVGIRKTIGSVRWQLMNQFFTESMMITFISFVMAMLIAQLALSGFNAIAGKNIQIPWTSPGFWLIGTAFTFLTGIIAGSYPAIYLSSFKPVRALKGTIRAGRSSSLVRQVLVVIQYTASVTLIIGTLTVFKQIQYARDRPVGYNRQGIIMIPIQSGDISNHFEAFRNDLLASGTVINAAESETPVTSSWTTNSGFDWKGKDPGMSEEFVTMGITPGFGKTIGWKLNEGRDFSSGSPSDSSGFIINEAAVKYLGFEQPLGEIIKWHNNGNWEIIGVIKDMIVQSPYALTRPMIFFQRTGRTSFIHMNMINARINPQISAKEALPVIESIYKKYDAENEFRFSFADQEYSKKFDNEKRIGKLVTIFATLAVFISCLGLYGLASFIAERRTKEIGIRKVMGASVIGVWQLVSKDYVILIAISLAIGIPIAWEILNQWLMSYDYHTTIGPGIFLITAIGLVFLSLLAVSYQSLKAALTNPVKSLRSE